MSLLEPSSHLDVIPVVDRSLVDLSTPEGKDLHVKAARSRITSDLTVAPAADDDVDTAGSSGKAGRVQNRSGKAGMRISHSGKGGTNMNLMQDESVDEAIAMYEAALAAPDAAPVPTPSTASSGLKGWEIAMIVVGSVLVVGAAVAGGMVLWKKNHKGASRRGGDRLGGASLASAM